VALMAGVLFLGQLLTMILVATFVIAPQADRIAAVLARNVEMVGATLDALPGDERAQFIARVNKSDALRIRPAHGTAPGADGQPTWLETRVLRQLAANLGQFDTMVWRGGGGAPLWVRMQLGDREHYWVALAPSPSWTPTGALLGSVAIGLTLSLAAGLALQRRVNRPLTTLADAVDAMPDTQPVEALAQTGPAEIAGLAMAFERMAGRLASQEADRAVMLAGISHDLKTPIAKLRLAAALHPGSGSDDEAMVNRQFERIERMLDQFLDFGRGADAEAVRRIDISATVRDVAASLGLDPGSVIGEPAILAEVRPVAFERAVTNIVRNAFVHGQPPIRIDVEQVAETFAVAVSDCGSGVSSSILDQLDRPFFRGHEARPSNGGVGLGLAIAKRFAVEHCGKLQVENLEPTGFRVSLSFSSRSIGHRDS
jgi:two-component system, OmpR family, osmolarity sensor histidine kinase EnvZ